MSPVFIIFRRSSQTTVMQLVLYNVKLNRMKDTQIFHLQR